MKSRLVLVSAWLLLSLLASRSAGQRYNHNSYLGTRPPELISQRALWLGLQEPVALATFKGKVVWLQFNF